MQVVRTLLWIVLTAILVAFIAMNWARAPVNFWPVEGGYLHFEWPVGVIALVFFLLGLLPMYFVYRTTRWRLARRVAGLESGLRAASRPPLVTATQLDAEAAAGRAERDAS